MHINYNFISLNSMTETDKETEQTRSDNPMSVLISRFSKKSSCLVLEFLLHETTVLFDASLQDSHLVIVTPPQRLADMGD